MAMDLRAHGIPRHSEKSAANVTDFHWQPSPNFGERRDGAKADMVVIHYTAMDDARAACDWLCDPSSEVSAHFLIDPAGQVIQMVSEDHRAWHAGQASWGNVSDINSRSIGIELANTGFHPFSAAQINGLEALLGEVMDRHGIAPERVVAHSDVSPGRKIDPGIRFDWRRLAAAGLSIWPKMNADPGDLQADLRTFGYSNAAEDPTILAAFRLRFRPQYDGPADEIDRKIAADLASRFPVAEAS